MNKRKIIYAAAIVVGLVVVALGTVLVLRAFNSPEADSSQTATPVNSEITNLIKESDTLLGNGDIDGAVARLNEAHDIAKKEGNADAQWDIEVRIDYAKNTVVAPQPEQPEGNTYTPVPPDESGRDGESTTIVKTAP